MTTSDANTGSSATDLISKKIADLGDWRGTILSRVRTLIRMADPDVVEEWNWRGTPVWSHEGIICTGASYTSVVKLTALRGASLRDLARLFNASLDGHTRRAIDPHEGDVLDASAFTTLICQAVAFNWSGRAPAAITTSTGKRAKTNTTSTGVTNAKP